MISKLISNWFNGRLNRRNYLAFGLLHPLLILLGFLPINAQTAGYLPYFSGIIQMVINLYTLLMFFIILILPIGVTVRRFHDRNRSGWNALWMIAPIVNIIYFIELLMAHPIDPNKYGDPDKNFSFKRIFGLQS
jgi:uncharacterized membrane protein YhaH (DUF805 family)